MREIKFRAWHNPSKQMFDWGSFSINGRNDCVIHFTEGVFTTRRVDDNSVELMQYTGLKDKNGVEIYEGDVCDGRYGRFKVFFEDGGFWPLCGEINAPNNMSLVEVVGNIYETPDLPKYKPHNP